VGGWGDSIRPFEDRAMLWNTSLIRGYGIEARDGALGAICDLFLCDADWRVRWLVIEGGDLLSRRKVLLHPTVFERPVRELRQFSVSLHVHQVKSSPVINTDHPVRRHVEALLCNHYGWDHAWGRSHAQPNGEPHHDRGLLSIDTAARYRLWATDGEIGRVQDFIVDDSDWGVRHIVADTRNWWPGNMVLIAPSSIEAVDGEQRTIRLRVSRQKIKDSPVYGSCRIVDQKFEDMVAGGNGRRSA
jgi:hypothetical protein